jgi:hypothetical protein
VAPHFPNRAWRPWRFAFLGLVRLGEARRFRFEACQGINIGFDLTGAAEEGALRASEHRHRRLWHGVDALATDHRQGQRRATGHGVVPARFFTQRQQQFAGMTQGQLGAGLHFEDACVGAQQHVVVDQMAEALLLAEHLQQDRFDLAHALFEGAVGVHQINHRLDVFVPGRQHFSVALAQRNLPVAGFRPFGDGHQGLFVVIEFFQYVTHAHVEQTQLAGEVIAIADIERVLDITGQTLQVAQVGFDFQAQAQAVFTAQIGEEVVNLRIKLETVRAFGHGNQNVEANPHVEQAGDVLRRTVELLGGQL